MENENIKAISKRNTPRDLFLHLLVIVTLYWSAVSFVALLWQLIDYFFPDVLNRYYNYFAFTGPIRFAISSLIIVFPVFILVSRYLNKIYAKESAVRESKIRKWLIYLTLFIASLVIIGDLITVINTFLGGEITARFILKALSVFLVAGVVFGYYLDDVRRETPTKLAKYFAWSAGAVVLIIIVSAFFIVGSPATARLMQFDQQKISDLQGMQAEIVNYWQRKEKLPAVLADLNDPISGYKAPIDPQTGAAYEYNIKDAANLSFELCAMFNKEVKTPPGSKLANVPVPIRSINFDYPPSWEHPAGRVCFERIIDKELYPPLNKIKN
ncbi:MAG: hypothetical protein CEN87_635 [Parcubacteria group bacterium Licking1014_1]|nr:MAG: hypothetical protein CEN87_635 [Parcubacteria group bacterium Licking1014_1]